MSFHRAWMSTRADPRASKVLTFARSAALAAVALVAAACESELPATPSTPGSSLCHLPGAEVGIIGDSYINFTSFTEQLQGLARAAGALGAGDSYVDQSLGGASMSGFPSIPDQWPDALADARARGTDRIRLLIADGGGNDMLVENRDCLEFSSAASITPACKQVVQDAIDAGSQLFTQAHKDGVEAVIFFFYPHLPQDSLGGGSYPNTILDYAYPLVKQMCESRTDVKCHFIDLRAPFDDGHGYARDGLIEFDGIHPTDDGAAIMATQVWDVMKSNCLAAQ